MLRLVKWFAYRDQVLDGVNTLLVMYPRRRQFGDDFPGLRAVIRSHFDGGVSPMGSALHVSLLIIQDLLGQLDSPERDRVVELLQSLCLDDLEPLAASQISGRPERPKDRVSFALRLVGGALLMARRMTEEGTLSRAEHAALLAGLDGALPPGQEGAVETRRARRSPTELFGMERMA